MNTLLLYLTGPMQAWGSRSRFDDRDSGLEPTRSGIIGLLACALGMPRDADLTPFETIEVGVRNDAPGTPMVDFHTSQQLRKADGVLKDTTLSSRHYLADARFLVGIGHENLAQLQEWEAAVSAPRWPLFLGRKGCPPAAPLCLPNSSIRAGLGVEVALRNTQWWRVWEDRRTPKPEQLRLVLETNDPTRKMMVRPERPLSFSTRRYALRSLYLQEMHGDEIREGGQWPCILPA